MCIRDRTRTGAHAWHQSFLPPQADRPARRHPARRQALAARCVNAVAGNPGTILTPSQAYAQGAARGEWQDDPAQHAAPVSYTHLDVYKRQVVPVSATRARTTGWRYKPSLAYVWPLWDKSLTLDEVALLRTLPVEKLVNRPGVTEVWASEMRVNGKYPWLSPARRER